VPFGTVLVRVTAAIISIGGMLITALMLGLTSGKHFGSYRRGGGCNWVALKKNYDAISHGRGVRELERKINKGKWRGKGGGLL